MNIQDYEKLELGTKIIKFRRFRRSTTTWYDDVQLIDSLSIVTVKKINKTCKVLEDGARVSCPKTSYRDWCNITHSDYSYKLYTKEAWRELRVEQLNLVLNYRDIVFNQIKEKVKTDILSSYSYRGTSKKLLEKVFKELLLYIKGGNY